MDALVAEYGEGEAIVNVQSCVGITLEGSQWLEDSIEQLLDRGMQRGWTPLIRATVFIFIRTWSHNYGES